MESNQSTMSADRTLDEAIALDDERDGRLRRPCKGWTDKRRKPTSLLTTSSLLSYMGCVHRSPHSSDVVFRELKKRGHQFHSEVRPEDTDNYNLRYWTPKRTLAFVDLPTLESLVQWLATHPECTPDRVTLNGKFVRFEKHVLRPALTPTKGKL